jgi:hypothetical protein
MNQPNSSTSSSDDAKYGPIVRRMRVCAWILVGLIAIDVLINLVFALPADPKVTNPSAIALYFEYGRSSEAKLARMTRAQSSQTAPITLAGWYDPLRVDEPEQTSQGSTVTFYGMSHAVRLAMALGRTSNRFIPRIVAGPGATANWAYGAYLRDRGGGKSRAVVLALMSANLPMITTMSPLTWNLDLPMPYTADRFYLDGEQLRVVHPPFVSFEQYVQALHDPLKWREFRDLLAKNDPLYNPLIMRASILDHSALLRLVRRAYGQRTVRSARKEALDQSGFRADSEQIKVARAIVHEFALQARSDGMLPVIFLVNNFGYSDYLFQALSLTLKADKIPCLSSHSIVSPSNPRGYLPDSHFTDQIDEELARALVRLLDKPETSAFCSEPLQLSQRL